jgi:hypothetical protein
VDHSHDQIVNVFRPAFWPAVKFPLTRSIITGRFFPSSPAF